LVRKSIQFFGRVQGVGFRYRAFYAAQSFRCTGWVKNEWDGSVLMEIQGSEETIDKVCMEIADGTFVHIEDIKVKVLPLVENERSFKVRY